MVVLWRCGGMWWCGGMWYSLECGVWCALGEDGMTDRGHLSHNPAKARTSPYWHELRSKACFPWPRLGPPSLRYHNFKQDHFAV